MPEVELPGLLRGSGDEALGNALRNAFALHPPARYQVSESR